MALKNVDNLLNNFESPAEPAQAEKQLTPERMENETPEKPEMLPDDASQVEAAESGSDGQEDDNVDEYGNKKEAKLYTEEEVNERINRAIRDRLSRGNNHNQQQIQEQKPQEGFSYDENSEQDWEAQLQSYIEKTVDNMAQKRIAKQQEIQERQSQVEFETRLTNGMSRFNDFVEVVSGKPITDAMTIATRGMKDPAAFIYAASKNHASELERISKLPDAYQQMVEVGKLEERMRKTKTATSAPKPPTLTKGDIGSKGTESRNIDDLIRQDAKRRFAR